jgi:cyclopropane-fatty-acyl-phospholipid synthase
MAKKLTPPSPTCEAIANQSDVVYERYMKYPTGCAKAFRIGYVDVNQLILEKW